MAKSSRALRFQTGSDENSSGFRAICSSYDEISSAWLFSLVADFCPPRGLVMRWIDAVVLLNAAAMAVIVGLFLSALRGRLGGRVHWAFLGILAGQFAWSLTDTVSSVLAVQFGFISNGLGTASALAVLGIAFSTFFFCVSFAAEERARTLRTVTVATAAALTIGCALLTFSDQFIGSRRVENGIRHGDYGPLFIIFGGWVAALIVTGLAIIAVRSFRVTDHRVRTQIWMFVLGAALNMLFAFAFSYVLPLAGIFDLDFAGPPSSVIFVSIVLYTILFHRFVNLKQAYSIVGVHVVVVGLAALFMAVAGWAVLAGAGWKPSASIIVSAFVVFGAGIAYHNLVVPVVNRLIADPILDPALTLTRLFAPTESASAMTRESALSAWIEKVAQSLRVSKAALLLKTGTEFLEVHSSGPVGVLRSDQLVRIIRKRPPQKFLNLLDRVIATEEGAALFPPAVKKRYARSSRLLIQFLADAEAAGYPVVLPLIRQDSVEGVLLLGSRGSGGLYYEGELEMLRALRFPLAAAVRRIQEEADLNDSRARAERVASSLSQFLIQTRRIDVDSQRQIVYRSETMDHVIEKVRLFAGQQHPVLVLGETGTGKELIARMLHREGPRANQPFVAINCAAMPADLWEDEMFGHARGAFTDAREARDGRLLEAGEGTLFLDEVGELPLGMQSKLLRVLQERTFHPLGSDKTRVAKCRFIFATNRDLSAMIKAKEFRDDLYYRISVFEVRLPPLRERLSDVPVIAGRILEALPREAGTEPRTLSPEALEALVHYDWPGNIRELENVIVRAATTASQPMISAADLALLPRSERPARAVKRVSALVNYRDSVDAFRRDLVTRALREAGGNKTKAAEALGLKRTTLNSQLKELGMD